MNKMKQIQDDEIDLFELSKTLWDGKWLISTMVAIAVLLGGGYLILKDAVYESKLFYSVDTIPPFYHRDKILNDFNKKFYSVSVFEDWKKTDNNTPIVFADFSTTEIVDGFVVSRDEKDQLARLVTKKKDGPFILVNSNQLSISNDFFKYAHHINKLLKNEYVSRAKNELNIIKKTSLGKFATAIEEGNKIITNNTPINIQILSIDRYIFTSEIGAKTLFIQRPSKPKKVSPKLFLVLPLCVILGGMIGVVYVLISNAIRKRKA